MGDDAVIQTVEAMALLVGETVIGGDRFQEARGERRVDALEELQEEEADRVPVWQQAVAP